VCSLFDALRYLKGTGSLADVNLVATPENGCSIQASFFYVQVGYHTWCTPQCALRASPAPNQCSMDSEDGTCAAPTAEGMKCTGCVVMLPMWTLMLDLHSSG
jgi:hypothetical protein